MTTSVALPGSAGTGLMTREDLAASLNSASMAMPTVGGDKAYLKMLTKGRDAGTWVYGQEETEVEADSLWAADPHSLKQGWVAWDSNSGGAPVQEIMVPINRPLPPINSLPPLGMSAPDKKGNSEQLEYARQQSVDFVCVSGEDEGVVVEYKQSSTGAMKLFGGLTNALLAQVQKGDDIVAIGKLGFSTYEHKKYGEIYNPTFTIVEWRTLADTSPVAAEEPAKEEAPTRQRRAAAPAAKTPEIVDEDPLGANGTDSEEDAKLAADYAAEQAAIAAANPTPRRRERR